MKKNLLLMMLCCPVVLAAQNGVTVSGLAVDAGTVTFNVSWNRDAMPVALWSDTVWVFVDYNKNGVMERLPVTSATASAGTVTKIPNNDKGVWVAGNARSIGSFSATVRLLTTVSGVGGACAYASNYPPVGEYLSATEISFTGTPIYKIVLKETGGAGTLTEYSEEAYTIRAGYVIQSFTDATGAPGLFNCAMPAVQTLTASMAGYCEGASGVQFALHNTESGVVYQLYRDNTPLPGATLTGTGSAATFGTFASGIYHAEALPGATCPAVMAGTHTITMYPLPAPPTITGPSSACVSATLVAVPGDHGTGIRWTDNSNTVPVRTVTSSGNYNAISISAYGCVSSSSTFASRISAPAPAGSAPDPLCCCACGLSASSGTCTATSTGLTLPPYTQCTTSSANVWEITLLRAWCPILHNCNGLSAVYNHIAASVDEDAIWYFTTCTNDNCTRTSSSSSSYYAPNKPARCWQ